MKIISYLPFNGVIKVIDYLQVRTTILLESGIWVAKSLVCTELKALLFVLTGIGLTPLSLLEVMKQTLSSGSPTQSRKTLFTSSTNRDRSLILLGRMIENLQQQASLRYTCGLLIRSSRSGYGRGIKVLLKVSNGTPSFICWQVQLRTTLKYWYGLPSQTSQYFVLMIMKVLLEISNGAILIRTKLTSMHQVWAL